MRPVRPAPEKGGFLAGKLTWPWSGVGRFTIWPARPGGQSLVCGGSWTG